MTVWGVPGATGFMGRRLCRRLLDDGARVVALVRPDSPHRTALDTAVEARPVDLSAPSGLEAALEGVEVCAHLAVPRRVVAGGDRPRLDGLRRGSRALLVDSVTALLEAGARTGLRRLVLASSTSVYGHRWRPVDQATPPRPDTSYGRDRLAGDEAALACGSRLGIEVVPARLSEVYGPGSVAHIPLFHAIARGGYRVLGHGRQPHQVVDVDDAVRALVACGTTSAVNEPLLVSGPSISLRQWIDTIAAASGTAVRYLGALGGPARTLLRLAAPIPMSVGGTRRLTWDYMVRPRAFDLSRTLHVLGPYQQARLEPGVAATVAWYRSRDYRP